ncbi:hydrogenase maturation nickel metallochaperone HypA [Sinorhizobium meliloti]|uniref:hydrogenase maturation nickel metallochaperone HypA n=1 Tax=Rhizobium meliloti TaxID=382 RepID=UPI002091A2DF|nr:hydrogenase maturation nickel metallochaperone HypA [Sinorhizobium meliloti]MCO5966558.1 hydrogenase maturation nickel metallochaperone HypA [Sinorhizobium meliloti]
MGEVNANFMVVDAARSRMKLEPRSPQTVCPYSGYVGLDAEFNHPDDMKAAVEVVKHAAMSDVEEMLASAFKGLNSRSSRNSLVRIEAKVSSRPRPKPRFSRRDLLREMECDHCGRDYGVYAIALFCPDCGAPNLRLHFSRECKLVGEQVELADTLSSGRQELAYRLLGNAHEDVLTAFEATLKVAYQFALRQRPEIKAKPVKNDFQNVHFGKDRFSAFDFDPYDSLSADELAVLRLNIQKRHIIGHNLGVVDAKFAEQATDARIGETVHLIGRDIIQFASIGQKVIYRLDQWIGGTTSPTPLNP